MKLNYKLLVLVLGLGLSFSAKAQIGQYNFFVGEDAEMMQTTIKGLGSINNTGFLDAQVAFPLNDESSDGFFATAGLGLFYKKFRFRDNLILTNTGNGIEVTQDNPDYYTDGFFSYSKSKLVIFTGTIQPELGFKKGDFAIGVAPRVDFSFGNKHKRKYKVGDTEMKFKDTGVGAYDVSPVQLGINLRVGGMKFGVEAAYMFTPFFSSAGSPQVQTVSVGFYQRIVVPSDLDND